MRRYRHSVRKKISLDDAARIAAEISANLAYTNVSARSSEIPMKIKKRESAYRQVNLP